MLEFLQALPVVGLHRPEAHPLRAPLLVHQGVDQLRPHGVEVGQHLSGMLGHAKTVPVVARVKWHHRNRGRSWGRKRCFHQGAGDGNRTRMTSLEGWDSAIELRPRTTRGYPRRVQWTAKQTGILWSGRGDLNPRPPAPKAGALPGCATPRIFRGLTWVFADQARTFPSAQRSERT